MVVQTTVVGCGAVAQRLYRKPLRQLERQGVIRVVALVDRHAPFAEDMQRSFRRAKVYDSLERALEESGSGLTLVLSPVQFHSEHTILALEHDNHVLCEKPMAATEAQCDAMIHAAQRQSRVLAIGMIRRFFPAFAQLREMLARRELGDLQSFSYREGKLFDWEVKTPAAFTRTSGTRPGLLYDIGSHVLDSLVWFFGRCRVCSYADDALAGVEGNVIMELETASCPGTVQLSWDSPLKNELRIRGSRGEAVLRVDEFDRLAIRAGRQFQEIAITQTFVADLAQPARKVLSPRLYTQSLYCQLVQVVRAIRLGEVPAVSGDSGKVCVALLESARQQAQPWAMPWLDAQEQEVYQQRHWSGSL